MLVEFTHVAGEEVQLVSWLEVLDQEEFEEEAAKPPLPGMKKAVRFQSHQDALKLGAELQNGKWKLASAPASPVSIRSRRKEAA